jgi:hypothetical protein
MGDACHLYVIWAQDSWSLNAQGPGSLHPDNSGRVNGFLVGSHVRTWLSDTIYPRIVLVSSLSVPGEDGQLVGSFPLGQ